MGKLGKKARKFAKKNLQSVMKRKRKLKSMFKKKNAPRDEKDVVEDQAGEESVSPSGRKLPTEDIDDASLDISTSEEDDDMIEDSDSEGYLSEDASCLLFGENDNEACSEDNSQGGELSMRNQKLQSELSKKKNRLESLKQKDPDFETYLQEQIKRHKLIQDDDMSDGEEVSDHVIESDDGTFPSPAAGRVLNISTINNWCRIVKEQHKLSVLPSLLNAYRAACHYGAESSHVNASPSFPVIQNKETFCSIVMFMLSEGDNLFRGLLGISTKCKMETILNLKGSKWESVKPMIKSYLTSTLFLLNQFSETDILAFALTRLRASLIFFAPFLYLRRRLMEVAVHLWATGGGALSSCSFLLLQDVASFLDQDCYDRCLKKTYTTILSCSKVVDPTCLKHIEYLKNSFIELCSIDLLRSIQLAMMSTLKLARIFQLGLQTKKKEALKKICSWEYAVCIDLWVSFVSVNKDNDLHGLRYAIIQVIIGVASLFSGQRYLPLKLKCIQWLNDLSSSSGIFIPISSLALDILESSPSKELAKPGKGGVNLSTTLKLPKHWLKSRDFQEECVFATVELLSAHFFQWSYHISFPELATVPVIRLKQFHDKSTVESLCRAVKRLLDQVEKNIDLVQRKREDASFSPKDRASADSFLQIEKSGNAPFIQYYKSVLQNAASRKVSADDKTSSPPEKRSLKRRKQKSPQETGDASANGKGKSGKTTFKSLTETQGEAKKHKKLRT